MHAQPGDQASREHSPPAASLQDFGRTLQGLAGVQPPRHAHQPVKPHPSKNLTSQRRPRERGHRSRGHEHGRVDPTAGDGNAADGK